MRSARGTISSLAAAPARRAGSVYIFVLVTAMLVSVIGISAIYLARVNTRQVRSVEDQADAMTLAGSAVEAGLASIDSLEGWRDYYVSGTEWPPVAFGQGTMSWKLVDHDGNLADDSSDPARLYGIGRAGGNAWCYSVLLKSTNPMDVLNTCIHSAGELRIQGSKSLRATGAPASTNANFHNDGVLYGSIDALTQSGGGGVTGDINIPAPPKALPAASTIGLYTAKATQLPYGGDLYTDVLSPTVNEYGGGLNPDGIYYINTAVHDLKITGCRIYGTLIVNAGTKTVRVDNAVLMQNYRSNCPVLLVRGELELDYDSTGAGGVLSEEQWEHNFNPEGATYDGESDYDTNDVYPSEIRGLVHCTGDLRVKRTSGVRGVVICEGEAAIEDSAEIVHDPAIPHCPPDGYTSTDGELTAAAGSWRREPVE